MKRVFSCKGLLLLWALASLQGLAAQEIRVSCELDSLIDFPAVWKRGLPSFQKEFDGKDGDPGANFSEGKYGGNPYIRFSKRPSKNVWNSMAIFAGSVAPEAAWVEFGKGGVRRVDIILYKGSDIEASKNALRSAQAAIEARLGGKTTPWRYRHSPTAALKEMSAVVSRADGQPEQKREVKAALEKADDVEAKGLQWDTEQGVVLLDHAEKASGLHLVRLRAAPAGGDAIDRSAVYDREMRSGLLNCDLSPLLQLPDLWRMTPDDLEKAFAPPAGRKRDNDYFRWLTQDRSRALFYRRPFTNLHIGLQLFAEKVPVEEVIVDFTNGKVSEVRISVWNYGDSGELSQPEFQDLFTTCGRSLGEALQARPSARPKDTKTGIEVKGFRWINKSRGVAYLEHNPEAMKRRLPKPEYLRIRLFPRPVEQSSMRRIQLPGMLRREDDGTIWIPGVPMVDQGAKGYCVVASCQRVFEYYRIPVDQYQIAPLFGTEAERGTSTRGMEKSLEKVAAKFHTEFTRLWFRGTREAKFIDVIRSNIDQGVPLLWCKEVEEGGNHMSLIIGYNPEADTLIYTDSWGRGHERKSIDSTAANRQSFLLHRFEPTL